MSISRRLFALLLVTTCLSAGCQPARDPKDERLHLGQIVLAVGHNPDDREIVFRSKDAKPAGPFPTKGISVISVGSRLRVVADGTESAAKSARRDVSVLVLEGLQEGINGTVYRDDIRPE